MYQISRSVIVQTIPFIKKSQPSIALLLRNQTLESYLHVLKLPLDQQQLECVIDTLYQFQQPTIRSEQALKDQTITSHLMMDWLNCYSQGS
jgi:hypothetical protein